jgi:hypothetical protein
VGSNWGNTLDRWYHRAAVVVRPREQAFANRAETSPARALGELAAMVSAGRPGGCGTAAMLLTTVKETAAAEARCLPAAWRPVWTGASGGG